MNNFDWRNGFAIGLLSGLCVAIFTYVALSSMPTGSVISLISAIAAVCSSIISLFALLVISSTLRTTETMLDTTRQIGLNDGRAWVLVSKVEIEPGTGSTSTIKVTFKNYGRSPARHICSEVYVENETHPIWGIRPLTQITEDYEISDLPPTATVTRFINDWQVISTSDQKTVVSIALTYVLFDGSREHHYDDWIIEWYDGQFYARKKMPVDNSQYVSRDAPGPRLV